jgi:hypothetical protein
MVKKPFERRPAAGGAGGIRRMRKLRKNLPFFENIEV